MAIIRTPNLDTFPWQKRVISRLDVPPGVPVKGDRYLVIATATGDWAGQENKIAWYDGGGWQFIVAAGGFELWVLNENKYYYYNGSVWAINPVASYDADLDCVIFDI